MNGKQALGVRGPSHGEGFGGLARNMRPDGAPQRLPFVVRLGTAADPSSTDGSERRRRHRSGYRDRHAFPLAATIRSSP